MNENTEMNWFQKISEATSVSLHISAVVWYILFLISDPDINKHSFFFIFNLCYSDIRKDYSSRLCSCEPETDIIKSE